MKLSVEAKVAAAVAAGFLAVTVGVVAQGNSADQTGVPNESTMLIESGVHSYVKAQEFNAEPRKSGD